MPRTIRVIASDGQLVGHLAHVVSERGASRPTGLVIEREGTEVVVPLAAVHGAHGELLTLTGQADQYRTLPPFIRREYRVIDEEMEMQEELEEDFQVGGEEPASTPG